MRGFKKLLGRLLIIALGYLLFIIGLLVSSILSGLLTALFMPFVSSTALGQIVSLLYTVFLVGNLLLCIYSMVASTTLYHFIKREWLMQHGVAVEATSQGVYYYENKLDYILTLIWQFPHSERVYTFTRVIHNDELSKVIRADEGQFVVIFDPDAPTFYDVQLPSDPIAYPSLIITRAHTREHAKASSQKEYTDQVESREQRMAVLSIRNVSQSSSRLLSSKSSAHSTPSSSDEGLNESGWRQKLHGFLQYVLFLIHALRFIANVVKVWSIWRTRARKQPKESS